MMNRRDFTGALLASGALAASSASTPAAARTGFATPPPGPWTGSGAIRRAGGALHYATLGTPGERPPLVLLHKLGGWIADWRGVAPALARDRQVIAFDLPGHGGSRWQGRPPAVQSVLETAALVLGALDELALPAFDLAGTSLGGCVAVGMAAMALERVRRLALPSCLLGPASTREAVAAKEAAQAAMFTRAGDPLPIDASVSAGIFGLLDPERIGAEQNASRRLAGRWIRPCERGVAFTDFTALMARVEAPALLLYGDRDRFFLPNRAPAERALRRARTVILPDASGFAVQDNPLDVARELRRFLD